MQECPHCGSTDIVCVEIAETERDSLYECEGCGADFPGDEIAGNGYDEEAWSP